MNRIKELRCNRGINMREAAKLLDIPYTTYVNYEKGLREPNSEMLIHLATFFNVSVDYLIGRMEKINTMDSGINLGMPIKINKFKKELGLTNAQLSQKSGVPLSTLDKITSGTTLDPKLETVRAIAKALGKTLDDFDDVEEKVSPPPIFKTYDTLNNLGKKKADDYIKDIAGNSKYTNTNTEIKEFMVPTRSAAFGGQTDYTPITEEEDDLTPSLLRKIKEEQEKNK